nr:MAG TPA_asm: hypothetical protein [Caudoviricetes sp.]
MADRPRRARLLRRGRGRRMAPKRLDRLDRTVEFHHHTQRGSPMRHPIREEPHG